MQTIIEVEIQRTLFQGITVPKRIEKPLGINTQHRKVTLWYLDPTPGFESEYTKEWHVTRVMANQEIPNDAILLGVERSDLVVWYWFWLRELK